jgi:hypothetical protein
MPSYIEINEDNEIINRGYTDGNLVATDTLILNVYPDSVDTNYNPLTGKTYESEESYAGRQLNRRNVYLTQSDYTQISDATFPGTLAEWQTYRQQLRDLPTHSNWPYLDLEDWPTKPS